MKLLSAWRFVPFAAVLLPFSVQAQLIKAYGAKLGANSSKVTLSYVQSAFQYETERRTGVHAAFFVDRLLHLPVLVETRYNFVLTDNTDLKTISKAQNQSFDLWLGIKL
jgi:hypothetical protein